MRQIGLLGVALLLCLAPLLVLPAKANMAPPMDFVVGFTIEKTADGPRIATIVKGGVADDAGLKVGDLILGIAERYANTMSDAELNAFVKDSHPWPFEVIVARGNDIVTARLER